MILSQRQLEEIAASTTKDFNRFFFGDEVDKPDRSALPTPIDPFAKNYLGLRVSFARLSPDGSICGVTAYADTEYKITELGITRTLALKRNQVILDESFIRSGNVQRLCTKLQRLKTDGRQGLPPRAHGHAGPAVPHGASPRRHRRHAGKIAGRGKTLLGRAQPSPFFSVLPVSHTHFEVRSATEHVGMKPLSPTKPFQRIR